MHRYHCPQSNHVVWCFEQQCDRHRDRNIVRTTPTRWLYTLCLLQMTRRTGIFPCRHMSALDNCDCNRIMNHSVAHYAMPTRDTHCQFALCRWPLCRWSTNWYKRNHDEASLLLCTMNTRGCWDEQSYCNYTTFALFPTSDLCFVMKSRLTGDAREFNYSR